MQPLQGASHMLYVHHNTGSMLARKCWHCRHSVFHGAPHQVLSWSLTVSSRQRQQHLLRLSVTIPLHQPPHEHQHWPGAAARGVYTMAAHQELASAEPLEYTTLAQPARMEVEVKKSRFIVTAWPITSATQAMSLIKAASDLSASHNCFAYRIGNEYRSSDDGEPGGTAGRPILSAIEGEQLQGVAVLVTRFFGGVKLGAGGLVRAYGGAARDCLRAAPRATVKARVQLEMKAGYEVLGTLYNLFDKHGCERLSEEYDESSGGLMLRVSVEAAEAASFVAAVSDATSGQVIPNRYTPEPVTLS